MRECLTTVVSSPYHLKENLNPKVWSIQLKKQACLYAVKISFFKEWFPYTNTCYCSTAPAGIPESLQVVVGERDVTFSWSPPDLTLRNGVITEYVLTCSAQGSTITTTKRFTESGTYTVDGFSASTAYSCSVVASNSQGSGPPATLSLTTQAGGGSKYTLTSVQLCVLYLFSISISATHVRCFVSFSRFFKLQHHTCCGRNYYRSTHCCCDGSGHSDCGGDSKEASSQV